MPIFAIMAGDRVSELVKADEAPSLHPSIKVYDVSSVTGIQQNWIRSSIGTFVEPPMPSLTEELRSELKDQIDRAAEIARTRYITPGSGQAAVYLAKQAEADALLKDDAPDPANYPLLSASVGVEIDPATGEPCADVQAVGVLVRGVATAWVRIAAEIEGSRMRAKKAVAAAQSYADAIAAATVEWPSPERVA